MFTTSRNARFRNIVIYCIVIGVFARDSAKELVCELAGIGIAYWMRDLFAEFRGRARKNYTLFFAITVISIGIEIIGITIMKYLGVPKELVSDFYDLVLGLEWLTIAIVVDDQDEPGKRMRGGVGRKVRELIARVEAIHGKPQAIPVRS